MSSVADLPVLNANLAVYCWKARTCDEPGCWVFTLPNGEPAHVPCWLVARLWRALKMRNPSSAFIQIALMR